MLVLSTFTPHPPHSSQTTTYTSPFPTHPHSSLTTTWARPVSWSHLSFCGTTTYWWTWTTRIGDSFCSPAHRTSACGICGRSLRTTACSGPSGCSTHRRESLTIDAADVQRVAIDAYANQPVSGFATLSAATHESLRTGPTNCICSVELAQCFGVYRVGMVLSRAALLSISLITCPI